MGKYKVANCTVIPSCGPHEDGYDDLSSGLWDLCEKYWISCHRDKRRVFDEMWPIMEDLYNASQYPVSYEMAKNSVYEVAASFPRYGGRRPADYGGMVEACKRHGAQIQNEI